MIELIKKKEPKLYIYEDLFIDMMSYANSTDLEMTMVLSINQEGEDTYRITKINIPPQFNASTETKTLDEEYPQWCFEQVKKDIALNGHLHTHPRFSVTPSGYDETFFKELISQTNTFQFRMILNQKGNIRVDIIDATNNYYATNIGLYVECDKLTIFIDDTTTPITNFILNPDIKYTPKQRTTYYDWNHTLFSNPKQHELDDADFDRYKQATVPESYYDYYGDNYIDDLYKDLCLEEKIKLAQLLTADKTLKETK